MSKKLNEEQEKYTELYRDLQKISAIEKQGSEDEFIDAKNLVKQYKDEMSFSKARSLLSD